jgi:hypothetical protein
MKTYLALVLCLLIAVLPGCALLTDQQRDSGRIAVDDAYRRGQITAAQRDEAIEVLNSDGAVDWGAILQTGGSVLASILLGVPVAVGVAQKRVRKERGPARTHADT